jgi:hypothetical protein
MNTPRTNAAWAKYKSGRGAQHIRSESCRLERELDAVTAERDALKDALIELESASEAYAADQSRATDSRCGLVQPITVEDGNRLLSALRIANELTK